MYYIIETGICSSPQGVSSELDFCIEWNASDKWWFVDFPISKFSVHHRNISI
jgi:hypothetical protein